MDNFINKLSQKISGQDSIKVNLMADAKEKEQMKKQLEEYAAMMESMRDLYAKQEKSIEELKELTAKSDEFTHKECVKVYRNVQALLDKQDELLKEETAKLQESLAGSDFAEVIEEVNETTKKSSTGIKVLLGFTLFFTLVNTAGIILLVWMQLLNLKIF